MLSSVVFLILPVTVVFAYTYNRNSLWPSSEDDWATLTS
jgi:hypothetical protein